MSSSQWGLMGLMCGVAMAVGLLLAFSGVRPGPATPQRRPSVWGQRWERAVGQLPQAWAERYRWIAMASGLVALVTWMATARPVHGLLVAAAVAGFPWIWHPSITQRRQIRQLYGLADWLQQVAASVDSGASLEMAIEQSGRRAPESIGGPVRTLASRLRAGSEPALAYRRFAAQLGFGACDHVVMVFLTHINGRGDGLTDALRTLSEQSSRKARSMGEVDAAREGDRTQTRWTALIALGVAAYSVFTPANADFFRTGGGQGVMVVLGAAAVGALLLLRRITGSKPDPRLLDDNVVQVRGVEVTV